MSYTRLTDAQLTSGTGGTQAKFRQMWLHLQADLTKLSTNSRQIFADQSSHFINFDQPELVVGAVREIIERLPQKPAGNM